MCFNKLIKKYTTAQHFFKIVALICALVLAGSLFIEHVLLIEPCILCTIQRILFILILVTCIVGFINISFINKIVQVKNFFTIITIILNWFCLVSVTLYATIGMLVAGRQSWLQIFSKFNIPTCSAGIHELLKQYPLIKVLLMAITGKLECSVIGMRILGLSLANWGFINFLIILLFGILVIYKKFSKTQ